MAEREPTAINQATREIAPWLIGSLRKEASREEITYPIAIAFGVLVACCAGSAVSVLVQPATCRVPGR